MLKIENMKLPPGADAAVLAAEAGRILKVKEKDITSLKVLRRSIDAREGVSMVYTVEVRVKEEEKILKRCRSKKVTAVVTLESGVRYSYADTREQTSAEKQDSEEKSSDTELKEGYITVKSADGGEQALLVTEQMPEVRGVAIVCEGGDNEILREKIENAVTAALNITSKRVYICGRQ